MILISGASGHLGGQVLNHLVAALPNTQIVASSRDVAKLSHLKAKPVALRQADYNDKDSLLRAFQDINTLFFVSGYAPNDQRLQQHQNVIAAAEEAGVHYICYTSFANAGSDSKFIFAEVHHQTETWIKQSKIAYTIFRNSWYADLLLQGLERSLEQGRYAAAAGEGKINSIPRSEIAQAIAQVIVDDTHKKHHHRQQTYTLSGPETFTYAEAIAWIADAYQRPLVYKDVSTEELRQQYGGNDPDGYEINAIISSYEAMKAGEYDFVSNDFEKIMGRKPVKVSSFIRDKAQQSLGEV